MRPLRVGNKNDSWLPEVLGILRQLLCLGPLTSCIDPTPPEFKFKEGIVFVDAIVSTIAGASFVKISQSIFKFDRFNNEFVSGATVLFRNDDSRVIVELREQDGIYIPPENFAASLHDTWELLITLPDGRHYRSLPESFVSPVEILNLEATYDPELLFKESIGNFVPGHSISVDFIDPPGVENYFYWTFRSSERLNCCEICANSIFRNGVCVPNPPGSRRLNYYSYQCSSSCWRIRFNENIKIFSDEFSNGKAVNSLPVADVLLYSNEDIVVEIQQFSLTRSAYEYYKLLKDIVDNNSNLNAPPPAALIGNIINPNDEEEFVLGRFTAASTSKKTIFIDRTDIDEREIEEKLPLQFESCRQVCPERSCEPFFELPVCEEVTMAPCGEISRFRTSIEPEGWVAEN